MAEGFPDPLGGAGHVEVVDTEVAEGIDDGALEALLADEPLRDHAWVILVQGLAASGRIGDARRAAQRCRREYTAAGLEPPAEVVDGDPQRRPLPVGAHPLDGIVPERGNLPPAADGFVGRHFELSLVTDALRHHRLVTLVGPGGVGKSRLALEAVRRGTVAPADGLWLCDLAPIDRPTAVLPTVARIFSLAPSGHVGQQLDRFFEGRSLVLLVDNCEHLVDQVAHLAASLLPRAPSVRILATSREPLAVTGERVINVAPLDPDTDGMALFFDRATAAGAVVDSSEAPLVAELCRHLDGLPLAIEMAAPWARTMSLSDLSSHLTCRLDLRSPARSVPARHRTRGHDRWSSSRLSGSEQRLYERLSVFTGTFSLEAAIAVAGHEPLTSGDVPDLLRRLVEQSLLVPSTTEGETRFRMLGTIAEHATGQRGVRDDADEPPGRKVAHFTRLAAAIERGCGDPTKADGRPSPTVTCTTCEQRRSTPSTRAGSRRR
jgi:predicted ATPase